MCFVFTWWAIWCAFFYISIFDNMVCFLVCFYIKMFVWLLFHLFSDMVCFLVCFCLVFYFWFVVGKKLFYILNQTYPTRSPGLNMSSSSVNSTSNQRKTFWLAALIIPNLLKRNLKPGIREREISTYTKDKQKVKYDIPPTNLAGPQVVLYYLLTKKNMKRKKS